MEAAHKMITNDNDIETIPCLAEMLKHLQVEMTAHELCTLTNTFLCELNGDQSNLQEATAALLQLAHMSNFTGDLAVQIVTSIFENVSCYSQKRIVRCTVYELIVELVQQHAKGKYGK